MKDLINVDPHGRIVMQGYDPVAFHTEHKPVKGNPMIAAEYKGYKYLFSSAANKATFEEQPEKYLPAYGGYCAYGVSLGVLAPVDIHTWEIIDGRLYLQFSQATKGKFTANRDESILKANKNWAGQAAEGFGQEGRKSSLA